MYGLLEYGLLEEKPSHTTSFRSVIGDLVGGFRGALLRTLLRSRAAARRRVVAPLQLLGAPVVHEDRARGCDVERLVCARARQRYVAVARTKHL